MTATMLDDAAMRPAFRRVETELLTLLACAQLGEARRDRAAELGRHGDPDWQLVSELALRHGVAPAVLANIERVRPPRIPPLARGKLIVAVTRNTRRAELLDREFERILALLARGGVRAAPFKGPALARKCYGDVRLRQAGDLDFLVPREQRDRTARLLLDDGYTSGTDGSLTARRLRASLDYVGQSHFLSRVTAADLEPHWTFAPRPMALRIDYAALWQRTRPASYLGAPCFALAPEDELIVLCINGWKDEWDHLRRVCDIAEFVRVEGPAMDWSRLMRLASSQGCRRIVLTGLYLAQRLFETVLPEQARAAIAEDRTTRSLGEWVVCSLFGPGHTPPGPNELSWFRFRSLDGRPDRLRYAGLTVFLPRRGLIERWALPDALFPLYYLLTPVHDYLMLPLWRACRPRRELRSGHTAGPS